MNIGKTGAEGEKRVANYLRKTGFSVIKRNFQSRYGEIDIIAENEEFLLFVEVKTRKIGAIIRGVYAVDKAKQTRIEKTAMNYMVKYNINLQPRFDIAEVEVSGKIFKSVKINYIEKAF